MTEIEHSQPVLPFPYEAGLFLVLTSYRILDSYKKILLIPSVEIPTLAFVQINTFSAHIVVEFQNGESYSFIWHESRLNVILGIPGFNFLLENSNAFTFSYGLLLELWCVTLKFLYQWIDTGGVPLTSHLMLSRKK
jgi:hypothetical protein